MALVRTIRVNIRTDPGTTQAKLDEIQRKADEIARMNPTIRPQVDIAAAMARLAVLKHELNNLGSSPFSEFTGGGGFPGLPGSPLALGIGAGTILSPPVIGAGLGLAGFAAVAIPTLSKITTALTSTGKAGKAAWAALDPQQFALAKEIQSVTGAFSAMAKQMEPVVAKGLTPILTLARDLIPSLKPLAEAGAKVITAFIQPLDTLINSTFFDKFIQSMAKVGVQFAQLFGPELASILESVLKLIMNLAPSVMQLWRALGPLVTLMVKEFVQVLSKTLPPLIIVLAQTLKAITPLIPPLTKLWVEIFPPLIKVISKLTVDVLPAMVAIINHLVLPILTAMINGIKPVSNAIDSFTSNWKHDWGVVRDFLVTAWDNMLAFLRGIPGKIFSALSSLAGGLNRIGRNAMTGFWNGLKGVAASIVSWLKGFVGTIWNQLQRLLGFGGGGGSGGGGGGGSPGGGNARQNQALARTMFPWGANEWPAFNNIAMAESGYNQFAENPSGAYGIPQALPPTKMPFAAQKAGGSNPTAQLDWMFSYIRGRYGTPNSAWQWHLSHGWYDNGGWLPTGTSIAVNNTGRPERILGPGEGGSFIIQNLYVSTPDGPSLVKTLQDYARRNGPIRLKVRN